jgi:hypothetical protein
MKIGKEYCNQYTLRGITLGQKMLNCCGHLDVEVVAIDYNSESVLISGFANNATSIKELSKNYKKKVFYTSKAKKNEYTLWISIDAIERYNNDSKEAVIEEEAEDIEEVEEECDEYETKFNYFIKCINDGIFSDGDEFCDIKLECSTTIEDSYHPHATPKNIKVFTIEYDFKNAYQTLSSACDMNDARELRKILNRTAPYIYCRETITEEIIHDLYLDDKIYSYQKMKDGRIIIVILN